jgi:hypothetical protein
MDRAGCDMPVLFLPTAGASRNPAGEAAMAYYGYGSL